jgi:quinol monooxygenase YgiN
MPTVTKGLWVPLEAKPGKEEEVASFLEGGRAVVEDEPDTTAWFAVRLSDSQFAIFDVFPDDSGRQAHLSGRVAEALMAQADELLARPPDIQQADVIASKLPSERPPPTPGEFLHGAARWRVRASFGRGTAST